MLSAVKHFTEIIQNENIFQHDDAFKVVGGRYSKPGMNVKAFARILNIEMMFVNPHEQIKILCQVALGIDLFYSSWTSQGILLALALHQVLGLRQCPITPIHKLGALENSRVAPIHCSP